jgi:threonine dehydratase
LKASLPKLVDIERAADRIEGVAVRTPLIESPVLSEMTGREVYLKLECFQPIKVFKIRGAFNKLSRAREKKVVAASSGNHGIAVAYGSHLLRKSCTVVVPEGAVKEKVDTILEYGADVVKFGRLSGEREAKAREISKKSGALFVHPFNDFDVISGQGTCGLEAIDSLHEFDSVLVPVGGGGLISGISIAVKAQRPNVKIFGVEPAGAPKLSAALKAGRVTEIRSPASVADGLLPSALGAMAFDACSKNVDGALTVTEDEIMDATKILIKEARIIAEPSGAAALAPLISGKRRDLGERVIVVISGGNISLDLLARLLAS